jgi:hypothetical protein
MNITGPSSLIVDATPFTAVAGQAFAYQTVGTFESSQPNTQPNDFVASVDWGDAISMPSTTVVAPGHGTFNVLGTHTYNNAGTYHFNVQVTDSSNRKATATGAATVSS